MNAARPDVSDLRDLYRELILDHAKRPRHFGKLEPMTHSAEGLNPLCGDKLKMYFNVGDDGMIRDAKFEGSGCAISVASASLLTDSVIGMSLDEADDYFRNVVALLTEGNGEGDAPTRVELGKLRALAGVREFPARVKCATLAWHALNAALSGSATTATTE